MKRLEGKVGLVTGAARGLGAATAKRLCTEGAAVKLNDIDDGEPTAKALRVAGHQVRYASLDVSKSAAWADVLSDTASRSAGSTFSSTTPGCTSRRRSKPSKWTSCSMSTASTCSAR